MTRDEWDQITSDVKPGIRFCSLVVDLTAPPMVSAEPKRCEWCGRLVWVDAAQELPAEAYENGVVIVCEACALSHPDLGPAFRKNVSDVYEHWLRTGVVKAIRIED